MTPELANLNAALTNLDAARAAYVAALDAYDAAFDAARPACQVMPLTPVSAFRRVRVLMVGDGTKVNQGTAT